MLVFAVLFGIVSFCHSMPRNMGDYDQLIFTQRSPSAAILYLQHKSQFEGLGVTEKIAYLEQYWIMLDPNNWVIHELKSIDSNGESLTDCQDSNGRELSFIDAIPPEDFQMDFKRFWPACCTDLSEADLWETQYDLYGSCIKPNALEYFEFALELLNTHNVGGIFQRANIIPGRTYSFEHIITIIRNSVMSRPIVKCIQSQNPRIHQMLFEVQICYNKEHEVMDCNFPVNHLCNASQAVIFS